MKILNNLFNLFNKFLRAYVPQDILTLIIGSNDKMKKKAKRQNHIKFEDHSKSSSLSPVLQIIDIVNAKGINSADEKTIDKIAAYVNDPNKLRDFDCLFFSGTRRTAKIFRDCLQHNQGYMTEKPQFDTDGWIIHAAKQISFPDLRETVNAARKLAIRHSSELIDWMFEVNYPTERPPTISPDKQTKFPDNLV